MCVGITSQQVGMLEHLNVRDEFIVLSQRTNQNKYMMDSVGLAQIRLIAKGK